jgi:diguanylate cyclase (GGDEF)-like protein
MVGSKATVGLWLGRRDQGHGQVLERSRWVFGVLTICSVLFSAPFMIRVAGDDRPAIAVAVPLLITLIVVSYRLARVGPFTEALEATCLCTMMAALPTPLMTFTFLFPLLWCRALYGGGLQMLLRSILYITGIILSVPLSSMLFQPVEPDLTTFLIVGVASIVFIGVTGRQLAIGMQAHDDGARRERLVSASGTRLLGITDPEQIRQITWETITELIAEEPGVRLMILDTVGDRLPVRRSLGSFVALPEAFSATDLCAPDGTIGLGEGSPAVDLLNQAVGTSCRWAVESVAVIGVNVTLVLGTPERGGPDVGPAITSLANQAALALQNSDVHHELTVQALTDGLTGLANRQGFTEATGKMIEATGENPIAVLFIDLDDFKEVNDTLGHQAGDELLRQVAELLTSVTRGDDVVARLGGDEFAILLRNASRENAEQIAERVVLGISVLSVTIGTDLSVGASIGVAMAGRDTQLENLMVDADLAMYAAKAQGKGRIQTYRPELRQTRGPIVEPTVGPIMEPPE